MTDFFQQYKKKKILEHIGILSLSIFFALGINMTLFSGDMGDTIKANILEVNPLQSEEIADIRITRENEILKVQNSKKMLKVEEISFSLAYNPESMTLNINKDIPGVSVESIENEKGLIYITLLFSSPQDIEENSEILRMTYASDSNPNYINLVQANFQDTSKEIFLLSTSSVSF